MTNRSTTRLDKTVPRDRGNLSFAGSLHTGVVTRVGLIHAHPQTTAPHVRVTVRQPCNVTNGHIHSGRDSLPQDNSSLRIMYNAGVPLASYVELFNNSTNFSFDLLELAD